MARLSIRVLNTLVLALVALPATALHAQALTGRFTVLIPDLTPHDGGTSPPTAAGPSQAPHPPPRAPGP